MTDRQRQLFQEIVMKMEEFTSSFKNDPDNHVGVVFMGGVYDHLSEDVKVVQMLAGSENIVIEMSKHLAMNLEEEKARGEENNIN